MVSKPVIVIFVCIYLVQPNEAFAEIDVTIEAAVATLVTDANNVTRNAFAQAVLHLTNLRTGIENVANGVTAQLTAAINSVILTAMAVASRMLPNIENCTHQNRPAIAEFQLNILKDIVNNCVTNEITQAIEIIRSISASVDSITTIGLNVREALAAACPAPAAGNFLGTICNRFCTLNSVSVLSRKVAIEANNVSIKMAQASALITSLSAITYVKPAYISTHLGFIFPKVVPIYLTVVQCTFADNAIIKTHNNKY